MSRKVCDVDVVGAYIVFGCMWSLLVSSREGYDLAVARTIRAFGDVDGFVDAREPVAIFSKLDLGRHGHLDEWRGMGA